MTDHDRDPLLRALGELEREEYEHTYPEQWEAVLAGRATPAEATAARDDPEPLRAAYTAAFPGPLPEAEIQAMTDRVAATLGVHEADKVVRPRFGRTVAIAVAAVLAVAAALVLWLVPREPPRPSLVAYSLTVRNPGLHDKRSSDAPGDRYLPDSTIDWVLSPELATTETVLRVLASDEAGTVRLVAPPVTASPDGTLRLHGRFSQLLQLAPGRWQLRFVVCAGTAPGTPDDVAAAMTAGRCVEADERLAITALPSS